MGKRDDTPRRRGMGGAAKAGAGSGRMFHVKHSSSRKPGTGRREGGLRGGARRRAERGIGRVEVRGRGAGSGAQAGRGPVGGGATGTRARRGPGGAEAQEKRGSGRGDAAGAGGEGEPHAHVSRETCARGAMRKRCRSTRRERTAKRRVAGKRRTAGGQHAPETPRRNAFHGFRPFSASATSDSEATRKS